MKQKCEKGTICCALQSLFLFPHLCTPGNLCGKRAWPCVSFEKMGGWCRPWPYLYTWQKLFTTFKVSEQVVWSLHWPEVRQNKVKKEQTKCLFNLKVGHWSSYLHQSQTSRDKMFLALLIYWPKEKEMTIINIIFFSKYVSIIQATHPWLLHVSDLITVQQFHSFYFSPPDSNLYLDPDYIAPVARLSWENFKWAHAQSLHQVLSKSVQKFQVILLTDMGKKGW